jgi:hypothetical protein
MGLTPEQRAALATVFPALEQLAEDQATQRTR